MKTEKNKKIGVVIIFLGMLLSFFLMSYFHLFGVALDFTNISLSLKMIFTTGILLLGLYIGLYFYSGKKIANKIGGALFVFLVVAFVFAGLFH